MHVTQDSVSMMMSRRLRYLVPPGRYVEKPVSPFRTHSSCVWDLRFRNFSGTSHDEGQNEEKGHPGPLEGYRVVEVGNFIAGPLCGTLLGYYGAEVIKIEPPGFFSCAK